MRRVDATRPSSRIVRAYSALAATRPVFFLSRHLLWKLDPALLRFTRGRLSSNVVVPTGLLETRGARTGILRRHAVIYFNDGPRTIVVASHAGLPRHPAWFHNLVANPEVRFGDESMHAAVVEDEGERRRLWAMADNVFPAFARYRAAAEAAGRRIPIVALQP